MARTSASAAALGLLIALCTVASLPAMAQAPAAVELAQNAAAARNSMIYRAPGIDVRKYKKFMIDPVAVYRGTDTDWGGASEAEIQQLAALVRSEIVRALGDRYPVVDVSGPDVARIQLTLAGLENNASATAAAQALPGGLVMSAANAAKGQAASFPGSVTLSGQITDSQTNQMLVVFVQKRSPDAMDLGATRSDRDAQKAAITSFADGFRKRLDEIQAGAP
jgi:hypothetical protein